MTINREIKLILNLLKSSGVFSFISEKKHPFYKHSLQESFIKQSQENNTNTNIYKNLTNSNKNLKFSDKIEKKKSILPSTNVENKPNAISAMVSSYNQIYDLIDKTATLDELKYILQNFKECGIAKTATNTVFGIGSSCAELLVIGEAPGAEEDATGEPFVGRSGQLITNALESINIYRENIFITNTVFWRPPGNRNPTSHEVALCKPFIEKIISLLKPKMILIVGKVAANTLLEVDMAIGRLRGEWLEKNWGFKNNIVKNIKIRVVYHPAYLLRNPKQKKVFWLDLLEILNKIEELKLKV